MAELVVKLRADVAKSVRQGTLSVQSAIEHSLRRYGATLSVSDPGAGEAVQYFRVEGVTGDRLAELREELARLGEVEAAYVKPSDALP